MVTHDSAIGSTSRLAWKGEGMADFLFYDHGSVWLMFPQNDGAREYAVDVLAEDSPMHGAGYAIEPRYVADIVTALQDDGFICVKG